jgi:hypothetical protein
MVGLWVGCCRLIIDGEGKRGGGLEPGAWHSYCNGTHERSIFNGYSNQGVYSNFCVKKNLIQHSFNPNTQAFKRFLALSQGVRRD